MLRPISLGQRLRATTALQAAAAAVLLAAPLAPMPAAAQLSPSAHPTGGTVVAGSASIGQNATTTTIDQSSQRAAVNWQNYNVGSAQTVQYRQPNASAVTLNTVVGPNPSEIAGKIQANGQIVVVNQAGLVFDKGAQINAAGIVVSAAGISTSNFMAGKMVFDQTANAGAMVENRGTITVKDDGLAALVAPRVRNAGKIQAKMGTVILAGAEAETLDLYGDGLVSINVTKQVASAPDGTKALVTNSGVIEAHGGTVVLTADAVDGVVQTLVDAGGHINANSTASRTGRVLISGAGGDVRVEGVVSAQGDAPGTTGGEVKVSGSNATIIGSHARISVSGQAGGGTVALGTTLKRARDGATGAAAATTTTLVLRKGSIITADATASGNGGRVVGLASGTTTMAGAISAKGGAQGGNGGFVEISGSKVVPTGSVDTSAPKGAIGMTLFDPTDVWVSDKQPAGTSPEVSWFAPTYLEGLNSDVSVVATGNLNVASSAPGPGVFNTLNLGAHDLILAGGTGLTIDQGFSVSAGSILLLTAAGPITLNGASGVTGGLITAQQLANLSPTSIGATAGNNIVMNSGGAIALGAATIGNGEVPVHEVDFYATAGITQDPSGAIHATTLRGGTVVGDVGLFGTGNQIANLPYFSVTGGDFSLIDSSALSATYVAGSNVFLQVTGGNVLTLTTGAQVTTGSSSSGRVSLVADALTVPISAAVTGGTVEIAPSTPDVPVSVLPTTPPPGALTIDTELLSRISTTTLRIGGYTDVPGGTPGVITPTSASIDIASALDLTGIASTLDLESLGPVTQEGALTVNTLTGNTGAVTLTMPGNSIANLGAFTANGPFDLDDGANPLAIIGAFSGAGQTLTLNAGAVTQSAAGAITAGLLTGNAASLDLLTANNAIDNLGPFTAPGGIALNDSVGKLTVVGALQGGPAVTLVNNTGSLAIDAPIGPSNTVTLVANGISQTRDGVVTAGILTGSAGAGDASLGETENVVTDLGTFTAAGVFNLWDVVPTLTVIGPVSGGTGVDLTNYGNLVINAGLTSPGYVLLTGYAISQSASGVIDTGLLGGFADAPAGTFNGGFALATATNLVAQLGGFGTTGTFALLDGESLTVIGNGGAFADVTITVNGAGNFLAVAPATTIASGAANTIALSATGGDVDNAGSLVGGALVNLNAGGNIVQSGVVIANAVTETAANDIDHAGVSIATDGALTLSAGQSINQSVVPGAGLLEATGGNIVLLANGTTPTYGITQQAGAMIVDTTPGQTISLTSGSGIAFAGIIGAAFSASPASLGNPAGTVSLTAANGDITETYNGSHAGLVSALNLTGSAPNGSALLDAPSGTGAGNQVTNLGPFTASGAFTLIDGHALTVQANVTAGTDANVTVNGSGNGLTVPSGVFVKAQDAVALLASGGNLNDSGTIAAPNIQLAAPLGTATVSGALAGIVPDPTLNPHGRLANGSFPTNPAIGAWIIGGNIVLAQGFNITGAGGGTSQLVLDLTSPQGLANLGNLNSPATDLYLNLGLGRAAGQIAVQALQVQYTDPGTSQVIDLSGTVDGFGGSSAASASFIYPRENNNYQLNGCPIGGTNCLANFQIPVVPTFLTFLFPFINPLKDLDVETPEGAEDILIILPDVGERDY